MTQGLSESLSRELAEHNVQVLLVEPGAFRTNFLSGSKNMAASGAENYSVVKTVMDKFADWEATNGQPGDPKKAADRIVEAVVGTGMAGKLKGQVLRLPLGPDCLDRFEAKIKSLNADLDAVREVAMSTNLE